jgi:hypothetical protein
MKNDKLYKYYFLGVQEPVEIQASCSRVARATLINSMPRLSEAYKSSRRVIGETVTHLLEGISSMIDEQGDKVVWVGYELSKTGWKKEKVLAAEAAKHEAQKKIIKI